MNLLLSFGGFSVSDVSFSLCPGAFHLLPEWESAADTGTALFVLVHFVNDQIITFFTFFSDVLKKLCSIRILKQNIC